MREVVAGMRGFWGEMIARLAGDWRVACCACFAALTLLFSGCAEAAEFGKKGTGTGEFGEIGGLAVSAANGDLYVLDKTVNHRADIFTADGVFLKAWGWGVADGKEELETCTSSCLEGLEGSGAGEFSSQPRGITVNNAAGASFGDVYVVDQGNSRVQKFGPEGEFELAFGREVNISKVVKRQEEEANKEPVTVTPQEEDVCAGGVGDECGAGMPGEGEAAFEFAGRGEPIAVGNTGIVYVGCRGRLEEFGENGEFLRSAVVENEGGERLGGIEAVAINGFGSVFVIAEGEPRVLEYEESSPGVLTLLHTLTASEPEALAYDQKDATLLVESGGTTPSRHFFAYDAAGARTEAFPGDVAGDGESGGIAWDEATGELYFASIFNSTGVIKSLPLPPPGPLVSERSAEPLSRGRVRFSATVDPEGSSTEVAFEYEAAPGVWTATPAQHIAGEVGGEPNFNEETVDQEGKPLEATVEGLAADKTDSWRVRATNANGTIEPAGAFTTLPALVIDSESVSDVTAEGATLEAQLNPLDSPTSWWFEYRKQGESTYTSSAVGHLAATEGDMLVSAHISGLAAHTQYSYRLAAENALAEGEAAIHGQERSFVTQPTAVPLRLLDGRGWEMVSPTHKQDASFEAIPNEGGLIQAAASGGGISYLATASTEGSPPGEPSPQWAQILSRHTATGWSSRDIASPHEQESGLLVGRFTEFLAFSSDLSVELVEPKGDTLLGGASERTPYLRRQALCEDPATASGCYLALLSTENVTSGEKWGGAPGERRSEVQYEAATPGLNHLVLKSKVPLTVGASGPGTYEWSEGKLELVSVLPGEPGLPAGGCPRVSEFGPRHVISNDGDRVIWEDPCEVKHIYMHEAASQRTVQLDVISGGAGGNNRPEFQDANSDASRVFFSDTQQLTADSHAATSAPDLYIYEANADMSPGPGAVRDVTVPVHADENANVLGSIAGVSSDGSVAYLVATGVLTEAANERGEAAQTGQPNLYRIERVERGGQVSWAPTFVATLSSEDALDWAPFISNLTAGVSANGRWLAFMSDRSLTGYDNRDAVSGQRDEEVFLYDAASRRLVCASCDPSGARPRGLERTGGIEAGPLIDRQKIWVGRWLAALIPGWETKELAVGVYRPRYLSNSGRLFFDSVDALVPQDVNQTADVYEYEPPGVGDCTVGAETFTASSGGCVGLVSSGYSPEESAFLDASESGNDVFFLTTGKLVSQDSDDAFDVYDAHVCGSGWECPSPPPASSSPCESGAACKAASTQALSSEPVASAVFEGAGSVGHRAKVGRIKSGRAGCRRRARRVKDLRKRRRALARCARGRRGHGRRAGR